MEPTHALRKLHYKGNVSSFGTDVLHVSDFLGRSEAAHFLNARVPLSTLTTSAQSRH